MHFQRYFERILHFASANFVLESKVQMSLRMHKNLRNCFVLGEKGKNF